jgi:hypothetical protein
LTTPGTELAINPYNLTANVIEGSNNQQRLVCLTGVNPTPVASAAMLDTNTNAFLYYDTHVVTGSTTTNTSRTPGLVLGHSV